MEILKFKLSGKTAFFKKPEVNSYYYFTYGQIHKAALFGIFGAILGYRGYGSPMLGKNGKISFQREGELPEYYQKLQNLKIGIEPCNQNGYIPKKIQTFNNSVGYASREAGGNLIIKEQWLENPEWNIYVLLDGEESVKLKNAMENKSAVYVPYLGKNDHPADISEIFVQHGEKAEQKKEKSMEINSLFFKKYADFDMDDDEIEYRIFKYEEKLPVKLEEKSLMYQLEKFVYTNLPIISYQGELYEIRENQKKIAFF
jgi:CRISPR-associated protein Cas5h